MVLVLDLESLDHRRKLAELERVSPDVRPNKSPAVVADSMDPFLWSFWQEERSRWAATIISHRIGPGRPAVLDELWDCRARREAYKRWFLLAEANWLIWRSWSRSLSSNVAGGFLPRSFPRFELQEGVRVKVETWESERYWRYRKYRIARREGEQFFEACHPDSPDPVCPRAG